MDGLEWMDDGRTRATGALSQTRWGEKMSVGRAKEDKDEGGLAFLANGSAQNDCSHLGCPVQPKRSPGQTSLPTLGIVGGASCRYMAARVVADNTILHA